MNNIKNALKYAKTLVGTPRGIGWKQFKEYSIDKSPFWIGDNKPPSTNIIKKKGTNCAGLINLMRRSIDLPTTVILTKTNGYGGTRSWFNYLKKNKRLKKIDLTKSYPAGTMLLRDYNQNDSGHLAVIYKQNKKGVLFSSLIHSVGYNDGGKQGVKIDHSVGKSYFIQYNGTTNKGHYTHICLPQDWLIKK